MHQLARKLGTSLFVLLSLSSVVRSAEKVVVIPLFGAEAKLVTKTHTKIIPALAFRPTVIGGLSTQTRLYSTDGFVRIASGSPNDALGGLAQVDLPNGATVQSLTCYTVDEDSTYNAGHFSGATFSRNSIATGSSEEVAPTVSMTTPFHNSSTPVAFPTSNITFPVIDNDVYTYSIYLFMQLSDNSGDGTDGFVAEPVVGTPEVRLNGCSVVYEIDEVTL